jgi:hypothetical protein
MFWTRFSEARRAVDEGRPQDAAQALAALRTISGRMSPSAERAKLLQSLAAQISAGGVALDVAAGAPQDRGAPEAGEARAASRILVSGIGRSGTTLIYQQVARLLVFEGLRCNFRYEPYLWNIKTPLAKGNPFDMGQLHAYGIHVHTSVPLVLPDPAEHPDAAHEAFVDSLFAAEWDGAPGEGAPADAYLTKVILGSGRLRGFLHRFPDIKIVANLRNPLDTLNSSLGMFSFLGEEFHADDRGRLAAELEARGMEVPSEEAGRRAIEWAAAWWRLFTQETLEIARDHPDNVMLFCYEAFTEAPKATLAELKAFLGIDNIGMEVGLSRPAGPRIASTSLTRHDLGVLGPDFGRYVDTVMAPRLGAERSQARADKIVARYTSGRFSFPLAGARLGTMAPIQLRGKVIDRSTDAFARSVVHREHPLTPETLALPEGATAALDPKTPRILRREAGGPTFGVVVTCYNEVKTIADAVLSCLNQTRPFDRIVVVDNKSTDGSPFVLRELAAMYSNVSVLSLKSNCGPSLARHLGIRALGTDYVTQLDGDDLLWPTKLEGEAAAIAGQRGIVAFSDIYLATPTSRRIQDTSAYDGGEVFASLLARRPQIPRDMTIDRELYVAAGGYDLLLDLYEDWDLKLRLAAGEGVWRRADGGPGTVYNRLRPGLSGKHDGAHARALVHIFLRMLPRAGALDAAALVAAYDAALGRLAERNVARAGRRALQAAAPSAKGRAALARLVASRAVHASDNAAFAAALLAKGRAAA